MKIKDWSPEDRPRERMEKVGCEALSDAELIAILLRSGCGKRSAVDLGRELIAKGGNSLIGLSQLSVDKLGECSGIGRVKAITLKAAFELGRRFAGERNGKEDDIFVRDSRKVFELMLPRMKGLAHEECWVVFLNRASKIISIDRISSGGSSATVVDRKIIIRMAIEKMASAIILVHNHPSGNRFPGECDKRETKLLKDAAGIMDIMLLDHIIVAGDGYYSFTDEG